jgi:hypothetical protein
MNPGLEQLMLRESARWSSDYGYGSDEKYEAAFRIS